MEALPPQTQTPFDHEQYALLQSILSHLSPAQKAWLGGYLTGIHTIQQPYSVIPDSSPAITVLFGSQSGNSQGVATQLENQAMQSDLQVRIHNMQDYNLTHLKQEQTLLIIVSTYGEGEPPDSAKELHEYLFSRKAPKLENTQFAVLALGDSSYEFFCKTGQDFDDRLAELGAQRLLERTDCDVDFESTATEWCHKVLSLLNERSGQIKPSTLPSLAPAESKIYDRNNPFPARLLDRILLNGRGSHKETYHYELGLVDSGLTYTPGDALGIYPQNRPSTVNELLQTLKYSGQEPVMIQDIECSLEDALTRHYEITTLSRPMLQQYAELINHPDLHELMLDSNRSRLNQYCQDHQLIDLLNDFPPADLPCTDFFACLRKLPPRLYSIASSQKMFPDEVHLTIATVRYQSHNRQRYGVCSTYLADFLTEEQHLPIYIHHNPNFKLPANPETPIIMIGPGTGVAPFRAFLQERDSCGARGANWLFFGDQHFLTDFLYQTEWLDYKKRGLLTQLHVAFSRDQSVKDYVQHRIVENSRELYRWLQDGAVIYVCGDAGKMAADVHQALLTVIQKEKNCPLDEATSELRELQKSGRYQRDIY